jgi:hypothetical protein
MRAVYFHAGPSQNAEHLFFLIPGYAQADPAVRAEVARDGDQLVGDALLLYELFRQEGVMDGREKDHS